MQDQRLCILIDDMVVALQGFNFENDVGIQMRALFKQVYGDNSEASLSHGQQFTF